MAESFSHYVRFARSLAMTSSLVLVACSDDPSSPRAENAPAEPAPSAETTTTAPTGPTAAADAADAHTEAATDVQDAGVPDVGKISGPLPPPELPVGFA